MAPPPPHRPRRSIRVVLASTALVPLPSEWKTAGLVLAQLGIATLFVAGVASPMLGGSAGAFAIAAALLALIARAIDIEGWSLLISGGLVGRVNRALGPRAARVATAATLVERFLLGALACIVLGHYAAAVTVIAIAGRRFTGFVRAEDLATLIAALAIGLMWLRERIGRDIARDTAAKGVWAGITVLVITIVWAIVTLARRQTDGLAELVSSPAPLLIAGRPIIDTALTWILGFALVLPMLGGADVLPRIATELPLPRVRGLRRIALASVAFCLAIGGGGTILFLLLVPPVARVVWSSAPLAGLAQHLAGPTWMKDAIALAVSAAAVLIAFPAAHSAVTDAERMLHRSSIGDRIPTGLSSLHTRFGMPTRAIDIAIATVMLTVLLSGGRVAWMAKAYAIAIAIAWCLAIASLVSLRRSVASSTPFRVAGTVRIGAREIPVGLLGPGLLIAISVAAMLLTGDLPSITSAALIAILALWTPVQRETAPASLSAGTPEDLDLLASVEVSHAQIQARPGGILLPVRNPHALAHVTAALRAAGERDVVVMTVRLIDIDVAEEAADIGTPTAYERQLFSAVIALAEQHQKSIRLLIVPARDVVDAIVVTAIRLRSSDVYVGESITLSAADQARMVGDAWERADKPEPLSMRLVVYHRSGGAQIYHIGAHPPALSHADLDLIHRVWLDAVKSVGPHVHHHDVVRAALTQMEHQLTGPQREEALATIREAARPAEELAAVLRAGDYARLRNMLRNRHAAEVATLLTELSIEDQVVVFRVLPRKDAAAVFEYLSQDAKETLLKAMAQEDVAALLNNMAPDDRTVFLEELPAEATRQLLALLTPAQRSVALTLLGYPERTVGRLMTPHYVAVREQWTVREVLDYVRAHGQDSETLNVIYVVDDEGRLIDDIRIREFLLAPLDKRVADLMDRRFVVLKATDDQEAAVAVFRQYDRSALPVTDTAGMLIGIVTIDDVLDVAEETATREIQRLGGSEALDEPYVTIAFWRMVRKRAGWLTALFLGEMLTATAMGAFEAEISRAVVLALFVPLIISSGGNSGSQAATLVIRAMALGEVTIRDWWKVMGREIRAGLSLGAILGVIGFLRITLWSAFSDIYGPHWLLIAITVSVSLVGVVLWGTLSGSLLPFLLKRLGFDPAASSAPFVATLVDVTGLVIYFSVALVVLRGTLL
jgi:magnesium transporter